MCLEADPGASRREYLTALVDFQAGLNAWHEAVRPDVRKRFFQKNAMACLFKDAV